MCSFTFLFAYLYQTRVGNLITLYIIFDSFILYTCIPICDFVVGIYFMLGNNIIYSFTRWKSLLYIYLSTINVGRCFSHLYGRLRGRWVKGSNYTENYPRKVCRRPNRIRRRFGSVVESDIKPPIPPRTLYRDWLPNKHGRRHEDCV